MDFKNIGKEYRPIPFWSWNEKLNTDETARQIGIMDRAGLGGYFMHARGGLQTPYMGEEWFENISVGIEEGRKRGMQAWAYDENGWPSGFGSGSVNGIAGACDLNRCYQDFLPAIKAGGFNNYGADGPVLQPVQKKQLVVFNERTEYFYTANLNDVVGYLPLGSYRVISRTTQKYAGYDWVVFQLRGAEYWTVLLGDRNRLEDCTCGKDSD